MEQAVLILALVFLIFVSIYAILAVGPKKRDREGGFKFLQGKRGLYTWRGVSKPNPAYLYYVPREPTPVEIQFEVVEIERAVSNGTSMSKLAYGNGIGAEPHLIKQAKASFVPQWVRTDSVIWLEPINREKTNEME